MYTFSRNFLYGSDPTEKTFTIRNAPKMSSIFRVVTRCWKDWGKGFLQCFYVGFLYDSYIWISLFVGAKLLCLTVLNLLLHCIYGIIHHICFYEPVCPFLIYSLTQSAVSLNLKGKALNRKFDQMLNLLLIFG